MRLLISLFHSFLLFIFFSLSVVIFLLFSFPLLKQLPVCFQKNHLREMREIKIFKNKWQELFKICDGKIFKMSDGVLASTK